MRILHISKYYYPYIGGVENICKYIVDNSQGNQVAVVCFNEGKKDVVDEVNGIKIYRVGSWITICRQALSLSYFIILRRAISEFKPDVIHFHWANPYPAAVLLCLIPKKSKLVVHWHMDIINQKKIYPLIKPVETRLLKRADLIFVTSPQYRDGSKPLHEYKDKVRVVQNAVEESGLQLRPSDEKTIKKIKEIYNGKKIVLFVGRHIPYKGLPFLIEAEKYIQEDCVIIIAGSGPLTEKLKLSCHSDRVFFVGRLDDDELRCYYWAASVFAFPSITKNEAFGVALAEAMFCYTPAVTFTIPGSGVNWVNLNNVTGIEVPNGDSKAYAAAIDYLLEDVAISEQYGNNAHRRVVENFTIPKMMMKIEGCYQEFFSKKNV